MGGWNAMVLQGQSVEPLLSPTDFQTYVRRFIDLAGTSGTRTILYATWARRSGDSVFAQSWSGGTPMAMAQGLDRSCRTAVAGTTARVAPVGLAWQAALASDPVAPLFDPDGSHPSLGGSYLAACVIYHRLTGVELPSAAALPQGLDRALAETLRRAAGAVSSLQ